MSARGEHEARLSHPASQVILRLIVVYAKRAARAYALCDGPGNPSWDTYYGLACTEEGLRDVLAGYVQHGYLFIPNLRNEALHAGQGAAAVAECKRAADALESALRRAGMDKNGEPLRSTPTRSRNRPSS